PSSHIYTLSLHDALPIFITAHLIRKVAFNPAVVWLIAMPLVIIYILGITMHGLFSAEFTPVKPYRIVVALPEEASFLVERISRRSEEHTSELQSRENLVC